MASCCVILISCLAGIIVTIVRYVYNKYFKTLSKPNVDEKWWGTREYSGQEDTKIENFKINVSNDIINDLNQRLKNTSTFEKSLKNDQSFGINSNLLATVVDHWKNEYNWKSREDYLNKYPQFRTNIQGLNIHYVHIVPEVPERVDRIPILLVHGWPSCFADFYDMVPLLTQPQKGRNFVFEIVIPSLPGYGFSDGAKIPGLCPVHIAIVLKNLMKRIGYNKFYIQGGDWGAIIVSHMATLFPEHVLGVHSTMPYVKSPMATLKMILGSYLPSLVGITPFEYKKVYPVGEFYKVLDQETGYSHLNSSKPDTVGVALRDSPVGLAAYILEKFTTWTNIEWQKLEDGGLTKRFTMDQLLDNVMIYWVTGSITTSIRIYYNHRYSTISLDRVPITVPAGFAKFYNELFLFPKATCTDKFINLVHYREYDDAGHFPALEVPKVLAEDIFEFVEKARSS